MQIVPGHSEGENRKEQLAVVRQPRARPALFWLRRASGEENKIDAAIAATVKVAIAIVDANIVGGDETSIDESTVKTARMAPAASVIVVSPTELVSGDAAEEFIPSDRNCDHGADLDVGEDDFETVPDRLGSGGCRNNTDVAKAMYPRTTFFNGV